MGLDRPIIFTPGPGQIPGFIVAVVVAAALFITESTIIYVEFPLDFYPPLRSGFRCMIQYYSVSVVANVTCISVSMHPTILLAAR